MMMPNPTQPSGPPPELSRILPLADISEKPIERHIVAEQSECDGLARRFGLQSVRDLHADLRIRRRASDGSISVSGVLRAHVVQTCVVSLKPAPDDIAEQFETRFLPPGAPLDPEIDFDFVDDDPPEPLDVDYIDLGEVAAQYLFLALDPYPRRADAGTVDYSDAGDEAAGDVSERPSPFATLDRLRKS